MRCEKIGKTLQSRCANHEEPSKKCLDELFAESDGSWVGCVRKKKSWHEAAEQKGKPRRERKTWSLSKNAGNESGEKNWMEGKR